MDEKINKHPQKMKWTTVATFENFTEARAKADQVKGKVKRRPSGKFEVRTGTEVRAAKDEEGK